MSGQTTALLEEARRRPLTGEERARLDPEALALVEPAALLEASAGGAQRLSSREREAMLTALLRPDRPGLLRRLTMPSAVLALAATAALVVGRGPATTPPRERLKGAGAAVSVRLTAQRPGTGVARAVDAPAVLEPGEALRVTLESGQPSQAALYEREGGALRLLWSSGVEPLAVGEVAVGPDPGAGLSLTRGQTRLLLVSRPAPLAGTGSGTALDTLGPDCPDCERVELEVEQR